MWTARQLRTLINRSACRYRTSASCLSRESAYDRAGSRHHACEPKCQIDLRVRIRLSLLIAFASFDFKRKMIHPQFDSATSVARRTLFVASAMIFPWTLAGAQQTFVATGYMPSGHSEHTATLLANGKVLIAGGWLPTSSAAAIYDPATGTFARADNMTIPRVGHTATRLPSGKVLIAGGSTFAPPYLDPMPVTSAELYDPTTGTFTATGSMNDARWLHTATLLPSGKVLITGGGWGAGPGYAGRINLSAELYDPGSGTFSRTGNMSITRWWHAAALLSNGKVLITGGVNLTWPADLYDPAKGTFAATNPEPPITQHTATVLPDGQVLLVGATSLFDLTPTTQVYDPASATFGTISGPAGAGANHSATLLPNGEVLLVSGTGSNGASLYDPVSKSFLFLSGPPQPPTFFFYGPLHYNTGTLLQNGRVLIAGGFDTFHPSLNFASLYGTFPSLSINNVTQADGNSGTTPFVFTVTLSSAGDLPVTLNYVTSEVTAIAGRDFIPTSGTLTFAPGETTKTIRVSVIADTFWKPDRTFKLNLSLPTHAVLAGGTGVGMILNDDPGLADLTITKIGTSPFFALRNGTFLLTVTNNGPNNITDGVTVSDILPAGMWFVSAVPSQGSCSGSSTVTCNVGGLNSGASATIALTVWVNSPGRISNTATVSSPQPDSNASNNSSTASITVLPLAAIPALNDLTLILLGLVLAGIAVSFLRY